MADAAVAVEDKKTGFVRGLGLLDSTTIVAGSMIGSGIFIVSAEMSRQVGSPGWLLVAWVVTGLLTVIGALSYGELAAMMPKAGGQYVYIREAFSPMWGFLYGWTLFMVIQTGTIAAVAVGFGKYFGVLVPWISESHYLVEPIRIGSGYAVSFSTAQLVGVLMIALLTWMNTRGLRLGKFVQNVFTFAKTGALIALIVLGIVIGWSAIAAHANFGDPWAVRGELQPVGPGGLTAITTFGLFVAICVSQTNSLFSADAWNNITFTAGEVKNPKRNIPLSLAFGTFLVIALYLLANVAYLVTLRFEGDPDKTRIVKLVSQAEEYRKEPDYISDPKKVAAVQEAEGYKDTAEQYRKDTNAMGIQHAPSDRVASSTANVIFPGLGAIIMAIAIMVSTFGCNNGLILAGARAYWAMARDGLFFKSSGELNSKHVPAWGLVIQGIWAAALVLPRTVTGVDAAGLPKYGSLYNDLLTYVISAALVFYILTIAGIFRLRKTRPEVERPYRAFGYPIIPALYIVGAAVILAVLLIYQTATTWPGFIIIATGIPVYFIWRKVGVPSPEQDT